MTASSEVLAVRRELADLLYQAMDRLSPDKRIAYAMHEFEDMGVSEIARIVGASPQTVWARVESARKQIQKRLAAVQAWPRPSDTNAGEEA